MKKYLLVKLFIEEVWIELWNAYKSPGALGYVETEISRNIVMLVETGVKHFYRCISIKYLYDVRWECY